MALNNKKVAVNSIIYTISNLILKASNFLLLPLYTAFLTTEDYGVTNLANSFNNVLTYIIAFSLYSAVIRFYADVKDDKEKTKELYSTVIWFVFFSAVLFFAVMVLFRNIIGEVFFANVPIFPTLILIFAMTAFHCFYVIYQDILKARQDSMKSAVTSLLYFFLQLFLNIYFVVYRHWGANGILLSGLICNSLGMLWMLFDLMREKTIGLVINAKLLKDMLKYSIPILPHNLSTNIAELTSKVFLNGSSSLSTVGIYGISSQFGSVADTIQSSISNAFEPWFYSKMKDWKEDSGQEIERLTSNIIWVFGIVLLGLAFFAEEAVLIMTPDSYKTVWRYVPIMVVTNSIKIPYYFYICILYYHKESTKYIFTATLSASFFNILFSYLLIPRYDIYGSIIADIFAMIFRVSVIIILANKTNKIGYTVSFFAKKILMIVGFIVLGTLPSYLFFPDQIHLANVLFKMAALSLYIVLLVFNVPSAKEILRIAIQKIKKK